MFSLKVAGDLRVGRRRRRRGCRAAPHPADRFCWRYFCSPGSRNVPPRASTLLDPRIAVHRGVEADRPLNLADQVGEDRPHRLEDLPGVLAGRGVALQLLGLGEVQLEALTSVSVKLFPPIGIDRIQIVFALGDDQVGVLGAEVDDHRRAVRAARRSTSRCRPPAGSSARPGRSGPTSVKYLMCWFTSSLRIAKMPTSTSGDSRFWKSW